MLYLHPDYIKSSTNLLTVDTQTTEILRQVAFVTVNRSKHHETTNRERCTVPVLVLETIQHSDGEVVKT